MIELIIFSAVGIINVIGVLILRKLIKDKPECVSKCCNINVIDNNNP